jgi:hypothetical protein
MKILIFNDTRNYHHGCAKVMEYLHKDLIDNGHTILNSITGNRDLLPNVEMQFIEADMILVNGEGTMHHDASTAQQLLVHLQFYLVTLGRTKDCLKLLAWIFLVVMENYCTMKFQTSLMSVKKRKTNTQNYLIGWKHNQSGLVRKCHRCIDKQTLIKRQ